LSLPLSVRAVSDRSLYFPLAGLSLALGALAVALWRRRPELLRPVEVTVAVLVLIYMAVGSARAGLWRDETAYLQNVAAHNAGDSRAWTDLGAAHARAGEPGKAI